MSKKALIVWGGWDGHEPKQVAAVFKEILEKEDFQVEVSDTLESFADGDMLKTLDLIVPVWTMGEISNDLVMPISRAVADGTGIAGCHGGMCDAFRNNVQWQFMTGGNWVAHPGSHMVDYTVNIKTGSSPLVEGLSDFDVHSEQYYLHIDPAVEVLATTRFPTVTWYHSANGTVDMPVIWTKRWGLGRVYYNSLGHKADIMEMETPAEMMRRGFLWAADGKRIAKEQGLTSEIYENTAKMFCRENQMKKTGIGLIGCGKISGIYFKNLTGLFQNTEVVACADLLMDRAESSAKEYGIPKACTPEELLADPAVDIVLNLTIPGAHAEVCIAALEAGKHVYLEKPLAVNRNDGAKILETAKKKGLMVGGAPDTFLGGGIQTCRKLLDDGWIGEPVGASAFMTTPGHERWHPDPEFYYKVGGGPMLDMGPYYLSALLNLLGPVARLTGATRVTYPERTITSQPKYGEKIAVDVPTYVTGIMEFASGPVGTILTSFDVWGTNLPYIEIYGTAGSMSVPDPNTFGGPVSVLRKDQTEWQDVPLIFGHAENSRGLGLSDMARAVQSGDSPRASGELMFHVLDLMEGFHDSADSGKHYEPVSRCERPAALPLGLADGQVG